MRSLSRVVLTVGAISLVSCDRSTPVQPAARGLTASFSNAPSAPPGKPEIDPTWANGKTVYMIGVHAVEGARESMPNAYEHAQELYLVVFPPSPAPGAPPITLPSGYQPQCDPCFHPGLPPAFVYHDHIITGAPGMGVNGTAGEYKAPWKIIIVMYNPVYAASVNFKPITSAADLDAAEQAGTKLVPFNKGAANPYELETGNLLICPTVSSHA